MKLTVTLLAVFACFPCFGQEGQPKPQVKFEVSSVKPVDTAARTRMGSDIDDALVNLRGVPMMSLIMMAYRVKMNQVVGPDFLRFNRFDGAAKIPPGVSKDRVPEMLQELLRDRFAIVAHRETRIIKGYSLTVQNDDLLGHKL